jgi:hypothetical protein
MRRRRPCHGVHCERDRYDCGCSTRDGSETRDAAAPESALHEPSNFGQRTRGRGELRRGGGETFSKSAHLVVRDLVHASPFMETARSASAREVSDFTVPTLTPSRSATAASLMSQ